MKLTCIMCPMGCEVEITKNGKNIKVTGNSCIRGERYAIQEIQSPTRIITALIKTKAGVASVKTTNLVPKDKIFDVLNEINKLQLKTVKQNQVVIKNVLGLYNVDVVVTRTAICD